MLIVQEGKGNVINFISMMAIDRKMKSSEILKQIREDRNVDQSVVADNLGLSQPTISNYERKTKYLARMKPHFIGLFLKEYKCTNDEIEEITKIIYNEHFEHLKPYLCNASK